MSNLKIIYVKEASDTCDIVKRIILKIKSFFNIIDKETKQERLIYILPIFSDKKISSNRIYKLSKKVIKNLEKDEVTNVVLSKYLDTLKDLKNSLYDENVNILDGRYLFKCLSYETIEYILKRQNRCIELSEVSILINDFNNVNKDLILHIAKNVKILNVITNHINKCKNIEEYLYNEFGILINISNNRATSLLNSKIILNIDFPEELVNQYNICNKAIIINILEKISIKSKKFSGININFFNINISRKYELEGFRNEEIYESIIYKKEFYKAKEIMLKDKVKIRRLVGNNGVVIDSEYMDKL